MTVTWRRRLAMWHDDLVWRLVCRLEDTLEQLTPAEVWTPPAPLTSYRNAVLPACEKCGLIVVVPYAVNADATYVVRLTVDAVAAHKEKCLA